MYKIVKKTGMTRAQTVRLNIIALAGALIATGIFIAMLGLNPLLVFSKMLEGSLYSVYRLKETINKAIPLVIMGLGIAVAFKMKFWNIGAEGQYFAGAFAASYFALFHFDMDKTVLLCLMMASAVIAGGIWAYIPALLKSKFGTSESLVTLMMNFIAVRWISFLQYGPWKDPKAVGFPKIARFQDSARLPEVFGVHAGWIIALVLVVIIYILLNKSKLGYEISVLGENENAAKYCGMNVKRTIIIAAMISGGLCGLTGMIQASAIEKSLSDQMSGGLGFTAISVAWLAKLNPLNIVWVGFLFAMMIQGGAYLQGALKISSSVSDIIQGVILLFFLGSEFFTQYSIVSVKKLEQMAKKA